MVDEDRLENATARARRGGRPAEVRRRRSAGSLALPVSDPEPVDVVDEWGYGSFPASDPPQH